MSILSSDPHHAEILCSGPHAWNAWREKNPSTVPGLRGISLTSSERQLGQTDGGPLNLKAAAGSNHYRVAGFDDEQIVHPKRRNEHAVAADITVGGVYRDDVAARDIPGRVLRAEFPQRGPRPHIAPADIKRYNRRFACVPSGCVESFAWAGMNASGIKPQNRQVLNWLD